MAKPKGKGKARSQSLAPQTRARPNLSRPPRPRASSSSAASSSSRKRGSSSEGGGVGSNSPSKRARKQKKPAVKRPRGRSEGMPPLHAKPPTSSRKRGGSQPAKHPGSPGIKVLYKELTSMGPEARREKLMIEGEIERCEHFLKKGSNERAELVAKFRSLQTEYRRQITLHNNLVIRTGSDREVMMSTHVLKGIERRIMGTRRIIEDLDRKQHERRLTIEYFKQKLREF